MNKLHLEEVGVVFKNFRGAPSTYNAEGKRNFSILISDLVVAADLIEEGWALKSLKNEDGEIDAYHLPVNVNYKGRTPPRIYKVSLTTNRQLALEERTIDMLDYLPIQYIDVILNPYEWEVRGETGIKAYCHTMYVIIEENELDIKWAKLSGGASFED